MLESSNVFGLMKAVYVVYVMVVCSLMGMFVIRLMRPGRSTTVSKGFFYGWIGLLVTVGVGIHILTFSNIPWVKWDLTRNKVSVDQEFHVKVSDYSFRLPDERLIIRKGDMVRFDLESADYTYGFGLFREDGTMVFQMQVVPGHKNEIVWKFDREDSYTIRSTEYSGPKGGSLMVKDAVVVASEEVYAKLKNESSAASN